MRAKEYIAQNSDNIAHLAEVSQVLTDLTPLRLDKQATDEYFNHRLSADIRRRDYLLRMELYEQGKTVIVVTHEPDIDAYAHSHIVVKDGRILTCTA